MEEGFALPREGLVPPIMPTGLLVESVPPFQPFNPPAVKALPSRSDLVSHLK